MKHLAPIVLVSTALVLAGCSTTTPAERLAANKSACGSYGFKTGTDGFATCLMQLERDAKADDQRRIQAAAAGLRAAGQSMQANRPVTCNTHGNTYRGGFGSTYGNATTTCY